MKNEENQHSDNEEAVLSEAVPLCPNCLRPCDKYQFYCHHCDSNEAINPLASYMPFVRIRFNVGMVLKVFRKLFSSEDGLFKKVFCVFVILISAPVLLFFGLPLAFIEKVQDVELKRSLKIIFWIIVFGLITAFLLFQIYDYLKVSYWRY